MLFFSCFWYFRTFGTSSVFFHAWHNRDYIFGSLSLAIMLIHELPVKVIGFESQPESYRVQFPALRLGFLY